MCTPEFMDAMIPTEGRIADPNNRRNRSAATDTADEGTAERDRKGIARDTVVLRRYGMTEQQAKRLAKFADHRGGLDAFENIEAARRAFSDSGAFTDRALAPAATRAVSRVSAVAPTNTTRVGATELIGLPLIRRG